MHDANCRSHVDEQYLQRVDCRQTKDGAMPEAEATNVKGVELLLYQLYESRKGDFTAVAVHIYGSLGHT